MSALRTPAVRLVAVLALCLAALCLGAGLLIAQDPPQRPTLPERFAADSVVYAGSGDTLRPMTAAQLTAALKAAQPGDVILLAPGMTYRGRFVAPAKASTAATAANAARWITVRTALGADSLATGQRMTPAHAARLQLARIQGYGTGADTPLKFAPGAHHWRLADVEVTYDSAGAPSTLVEIGNNDQARADSIPAYIVLDRVYVHANPWQNTRRCVLANGRYQAVMHSTLDECHAKGFDATAIGSVSGPGPTLIHNNYVAGSGMGIFFGGADPKIQPLSPSDVVITGNHVTRPVTWQGPWTVKNLLELKHAKRVLIEGNTFENNWVDGQAGTAILFKSVNQTGKAPWSQTADVTFRRNVVRNAPAGLTIAASPETHPVQLATRFEVTDNLFYNIGEFAGTKSGRLVVLSGALTDVTLARNAFLHNGVATHALVLDAGKMSARLSVTDNVFSRGTYGVWSGSGAKNGQAALDKTWPGSWTWKNNVILHGAKTSEPYPEGTTFLVQPDVVRALAGAVSSTLPGVLHDAAR